jgi:hypothetical protein
VELNRDEYTRPGFAERADAEVKLVEANILSGEEVRAMERFNGPGPAIALTGGDTTGNDMPAQQTAADMPTPPSRGGQP